MFVPVVLCTSLENLMRPMLQVFTSTFSMGSISKGLFLQLHVKVHVVPHCTKTDFCWMIASQPAPLLPLSGLPLMHCLCQVRYLYCNGTAAVYFILWSYLIFCGHWSLFLISTRQLKHDVNAKVQENVQRRKKISLGPFILHYWKPVHMDIRVAHYLKNTAATHETGVLWEIFRPTMLAWCILLHWEWRLQKKRMLIA